MKRMLIFVYGVVCYLGFWVTALYAIGFLGNLWVPKSIDAAPTAPFLTALLINLGLLSLFAVQHSVMARPAFKAQWTRIIPKAAERSTYVLFSSAALLFLFWQWQPMGGMIWDLQSPVARAAMMALYLGGWGIVVYTTFLINHFDLFGLRQVWLHLRGREYTHLRFRTPGPYKVVRHPLYIGWLLAFWATPTMTSAHLFFALVTTAYILVAIQFEERDLVKAHGKSYEAYRRQVPMLVPRLKTGTPALPTEESAARQEA